MVIQNSSFILVLLIVFLGIIAREETVIKIGGIIRLRMDDIYLFLITGLLIIFAGVRGDFSRDYRNYVWSHTVSFPQCTLIELLKESTDIEYSYIILSKFLYFINKSIVLLMLVIAVVELASYCYVIKNYSKDYLISLILFVGLDNYFISFNLMKNILACALFLAASKNIFEGKMKRYIIEILLISTVHQSAILMIPMYWILRYDYKKNKEIMLLCVSLIAVFCLFFRRVVFFVQSVIGYNWDENSYGVGTGSLGSVIKTLFLFSVVLVLIGKLNYQDIEERVYFNGCIFNVLFQIFSYHLYMIQRIGFYFSGFFILLIPLLLSRHVNHKLFRIGFISFVVLYTFIFRRDEIYYTFLNNQFTYF